MTARRVLTSTRVLKAVTRPALSEDLRGVVGLLGALGSGATEETVADFLRRGGEVQVASLLGELCGVGVLEWLHPLQEARPQAWLTALVTGAHARHRGVARALIDGLSQRVLQAGGDRLMLGCQVERDDVRAFLAAAGFEARHLVFERAVR